MLKDNVRNPESLKKGMTNERMGLRLIYWLIAKHFRRLRRWWRRGTKVLKGRIVRLAHSEPR